MRVPLPEDTAPGRALELVEELGRVVVTSPHAQYSVTTDRRHVVRHAIVGGFVGWWVGGALALLVPWPSGRWVVVLAVLVVGAALWAGRFPPGARWWVQVDRYTPEEDVGGTVAWHGVRRREELGPLVDEVVGRIRSGDLDAEPERDGLDLIRLRWRG